MATYGYMRVSTEDQTHDLQYDALIKAGIDPANIFADKISGMAIDKPEQDKLLALLKPNDTLAVWKIDRLGRSTGRLCLLIEELKQRGIHFKSLSDPIDTTSAFGVAMMGLIAVFAQLERDLISQRTKAGLEARRQRGQKLGPKFKYTPEQRAQAIELYRTTDLNMAKVANKLGLKRWLVEQICKGIEKDLGVHPTTKSPKTISPAQQKAKEEQKFRKAKPRKENVPIPGEDPLEYLFL